MGVCLCVLTVAGFAAPLGWAFDQASQFPGQYALFLGLLAGLFAWKRRFAHGALFATFALLNLVPLLPYLGPAHPAPPAEEARNSLRVLTANVHYWNPRPERIVPYAEAKAVDVVVLMELTPARLSRLSALLDARYPHRAHVAYDGGRNLLAVWSRYPLRSVSARPAGPPDRPTLTARVDAPGGSLTLVTVHTAAPFLPWGARRRNAQMEAVAARVAAEVPGPVVLVGDLNTAPWSRAVRDFLQTSGMQDSSLSLGLTPTWPAYLPPPLRIPLDQCYTGNGCRAVRKETGPFIGSDHLPLLVEVCPERTTDQPVSPPAPGQ